MSRSLALYAAILLVVAAQACLGRELHAERSLYRNILVTEVDGMVCLHFSVRREEHSQSCRWPLAPRAVVFPYSRMMFASLLAAPAPRRVLMVGLGGGTIPVALHELLPAAQIDIVEIDAAVLRVAQRYFDFHSAPNMTATIADARVFIKRALKSGRQYDLILLDAFNGDYIPEHLMTREFLTECRSLLSTNGVLAANTFSISKLYDHESVTYRAVFPEFLTLKTKASLNRIIIASKAPLPADELIARRAAELSTRLAPYQIEIDTFAAQLSRAVDWNPGARVLTDQYSPVNLLRGQ